MLNHLYNRLDNIEHSLRKNMAAPTVPIYDLTNLPQDAVNSQIVLGTDNSINWYDGILWQTQPGSPATVGNVPQDPVEGQIAIGSDYSLCWFVNGSWYGFPGISLTGNTPQDPVEGQLAVGTNTLLWYCDGNWYGFNFNAGSSGVIYIPSFLVATGNNVHLTANTTHLIEQHFVSLTSRDLYINGSLVRSEGPSGASPFEPRFYIGLPFVPNGVDYPNFIYDIWDLKIGTSRGATNIFADPLSTVPTSTNYDISSSLGITTDTLVGIGSVVQMQAIWDSSAFSYPNFIVRNIFGIHGQTDMWTSFKIQFPSSTITQLQSVVDDWRDSLTIIGQFSDYQLILDCDVI